MGTFRFKSDLRNHQAIVQPRLYDSLMVTQITLVRLQMTHPTQTSALKFNHFRTEKKINSKQNSIWGCPLKSEAVTIYRPLIIQFAAICSALSASRPELKSGTQVAFSTALCVLNYIL